MRSLAVFGCVFVLGGCGGVSFEDNNEGILKPLAKPADKTEAKSIVRQKAKFQPQTQAEKPFDYKEITERARVLWKQIDKLENNSDVYCEPNYLIGCTTFRHSDSIFTKIADLRDKRIALRSQLPRNFYRKYEKDSDKARNKKYIKITAAIPMCYEDVEKQEVWGKTMQVDADANNDGTKERFVVLQEKNERYSKSTCLLVFQQEGSSWKLAIGQLYRWAVIKAFEVKDWNQDGSHEVVITYYTSSCGNKGGAELYSVVLLRAVTENKQYTLAQMLYYPKKYISWYYGAASESEYEEQNTSYIVEDINNDGMNDVVFKMHRRKHSPSSNDWREVQNWREWRMSPEPTLSLPKQNTLRKDQFIFDGKKYVYDGKMHVDEFNRLLTKAANMPAKESIKLLKQIETDFIQVGGAVINQYFVNKRFDGVYPSKINYLMANKLAALGKYREAYGKYMSVRRSADANIRLGDICFTQFRAYKFAIEHYRAAIKYGANRELLAEKISRVELATRKAEYTEMSAGEDKALAANQICVRGSHRIESKGHSVGYWMSDGKTILVNERETNKRISLIYLLDTETNKKTDLGRALYALPFGEGNKVLAVDYVDKKRHLYVLAPVGSKEKWSDDELWYSHSDVVLASPDGKYVVANLQNRMKSRLRLYSSDGKMQEILNVPGRLYIIGWQVTGELLVSVDGIYRSYNVAAKTWRDVPLSDVKQGNYFRMLSPSGRLSARIGAGKYSSSNDNLWIKDNNSNTEVLVEGSGVYKGNGWNLLPKWSPDGNKIMLDCGNEIIILTLGKIE